MRASGGKIDRSLMLIGPGDHERAAHSSSMEGDNDTAMVYAVMALASAVNRLAAAQEVIANEAVC